MDMGPLYFYPSHPHPFQQLTSCPMRDVAQWLEEDANFDQYKKHSNQVDPPAHAPGAEQTIIHCKNTIAFHNPRNHPRNAVFLMAWNDLEIRHRGKSKYSVVKDDANLETLGHKPFYLDTEANKITSNWHQGCRLLVKQARVKLEVGQVLFHLRSGPQHNNSKSYIHITW